MQFGHSGSRDHLQVIVLVAGTGDIELQELPKFDIDYHGTQQNLE